MGSVATIGRVQIRAALMAMRGTTLLSSVFVCISNAILKMDFVKGNDNDDGTTTVGCGRFCRRVLRTVRVQVAYSFTSINRMEFLVQTIRASVAARCGPNASQAQMKTKRRRSVRESTKVF